MKNRPKSSQKPSENDENSTKNEPKINLGQSQGSLGGFWRPRSKEEIERERERERCIIVELGIEQNWMKMDIRKNNEVRIGWRSR